LSESIFVIGRRPSSSVHTFSTEQIMSQPFFTRFSFTSRPAIHGSLLLGSLLALGCTEAHAVTPDGGIALGDAAEVRADAPVLRPDAPRPSSDLLATCLSEGRGLVEVATVDNNDSADHGELLRFGLSPAGVIAAAGGDGTLKLWTLDAELLGTFNGGIIAYGPEIPAARITDITFDGESIVVGDIRGIVLQMDPGGGLWPIGGTTPEIAIRAVAFDAAHRTLAHAQEGDVAPLLIRTEDATVELETELVIEDLMFAANGDLWVAGSRDRNMAMERRTLGAFDTVTTEFHPVAAGTFLEMASIDSGPEHGRLAAVGASWTLLGTTTFVPGGGRSIALASDGESTVALIAGPSGLEARNALDGSGTPLLVSASPLALGDSVTVRIDATGTLAVVGGSDAQFHVLSCAP